ncbi:MAG: hypothetical protein MKZ59_06215, partial [Deinococcales bacterium]|nr:hypothetical protein [Deinococcales bacterium]
MLKTALQLYTVRNLPNGPETHFACAAEAGYTGVELLGDHGLESEAMSELLEKYGLEPTSSHVALDELESIFDEFVVHLCHLLDLAKFACYLLPLVALVQERLSQVWEFSYQLP